MARILSSTHKHSMFREYDAYHLGLEGLARMNATT